MSEFKGTKWIQTGKNGVHYLNGENVCITNTFDDKCKANAILISKAPEMLEMLESVAAMFAKGQIITVDNVVKKREEIKQLIKEATRI